MKFMRFSGWPACGAAVLGALALGLGGAQVAMAAMAAPANDPGLIPVPCSTGALAYAISHAPNHATLGLVPSCTYTLYKTLPTVTQTLTIAGNGDKIQRPSWASSFGLFAVSGYGNLTLSHLTLTGGRASKGGAVYASGKSLTVINCYLAGNTATGMSGGGAIFNDDGSVLTVLNSTLTANRAYGPGGAISSAGSFSALSDTFSANSAGGDGGAIFTAEDQSGPAAPAASATAGPSGSPMDSIYLSGGSVIGNSSGYDGGGIAVYGGASIKNALLNSNRARHHGGGLYNGSPGTATVLNTQVASNSAGDGGGGIYNSGTGVHLFGSTKVNYNKPDNCRPFILGCFL